MIPLLLLASLTQGPVQKGTRPSDPLRQDQGERIGLESPLIDGSDWEAILSQELELRVTKSASLLAPLSLSWRGSRTAQIQWTLDGLPLGDALGGAAGLRSLDPQLFGRLTAFASSGSSTDAPIGGELALSSSRSTQQAQLTVDQLGRTAWSVGVRHKRRSLALSTDQTPGRFNYFDDGATLWTSSDDQISQRRNNDAGRAGFLWREQHSPRWITRVLVSALAGGVPGSANQPLLSVREKERLRLVHSSWQSRRGVSRVDLSVVERFHQLDDPSAELTGLFGLQPQSLGRRLFANWRYQQRTPAQGFEVHLRGVGDHLTRQPGPTSAWASGYRLKSQLGGTYRRRLSPSLQATGWIMASLVDDRNKALIAQLPESLQATEPSDHGLFWSPGMSLSITPSARLRLIAGHRPPTLLERVGQHGGLRGNPALRPERSWTLDGRMIRRIATLELRGSSYARRSVDLIDWNATSFGRAMPINRALVTIAGVNVSARWRTQKIDTRLAYRWQGEWALDSPLDQQPKRLSGSSEHVGRWTLYWTPKAWRVGVGLDAKSPYYFDAANLRRVRSQPLLSALIEREMIRGMKVQLAVYNASNVTKDELTLLPTQHRVDVAHQDRWGHPLPGRRLQLGVSYNER